MRLLAARQLALAFGLAAVLIIGITRFFELGLSSFGLSRKSAGDFQADRLLLITAYFPLKAAKHSHAEYDYWLTNFMGRLHTDMYIFCPPAEEAHLRDLVGKAALSSGNHAAGGVAIGRKVYFDTRFTTSLETPVLSSFVQQADDQWAKDVEKHINNPDLYAIWNSKAYFVGEAVRETTSDGRRAYQYYFWQDAGAMRTANTLRYWPDMGRVQEVFREAEDVRESDNVTEQPLIMFPFWRMAHGHEKAWTEDQGGIATLLTEGSFFGGTKASVLWFETAFYRLFDKLLATGHFVGRDQDVFNTLIAQHASNFFGPVPDAHNDMGDWGKCGDRWYYYIQWIADAAERQAMETTYGWQCPLVPVDYPFL